MLLSNAAEGKMVMCVLLCCSVLLFSSVWIFVVPSSRSLMTKSWGGGGTLVVFTLI